MSAIDHNHEAARLESALEHLLARREGAPPRISEALRYAVLPGGARIRPRLCLAVAGACDAPELALGVACSLELLHCASLVHDDLPCFDDADLRRGKPSLHKAYGQPLAVLAGDALIVTAFEATAVAAGRWPRRLAPLMQGLARAAGPSVGLVAGQAWESEPSVDLRAYHRAKTGSLFIAATTLGAICAGRDPAPWAVVGERLGAAYQVADDLHDAHGTGLTVGKASGRDLALGRPNAAHALGTAEALEHLQSLVEEATAAVPSSAPSVRLMIAQIAERLVPPSLRRSAA